MSKTKLEVQVRVHRDSGTTTKVIPVWDVDRVFGRLLDLDEYVREIAARKGWLGGEPVRSLDYDLTSKDC